jgi:4a-hydroxytetrahydrobiopterin dehydratase
MAKWIKENEQLTKEFSFKNFVEAVSFVNSVAGLAEKNNHHPDILIYSYKNVRLTLSTHSEGKVTEKDYHLAEQIDKL